MTTVHDIFKKGIKNFEESAKITKRMNKDRKRLTELHRVHWKDLYITPLV